MRGGCDDTGAYDSNITIFQLQEDARHALDEYGVPPFESEAEREHATRSYVRRDRRARHMGLDVPHLSIDMLMTTMYYGSLPIARPLYRWPLATAPTQ